MSSKPLVQDFADRLAYIVDEYRDQGLTYAECVGAIEIQKADILDQMRDESSKDPEIPQ